MPKNDTVALVGSMTTAVLIGAVLGAFGGGWAATSWDSTPYAEVDLNTAQVEGVKTGKGQAGQEAAQDKAAFTSSLAKSEEKAAQLESSLESAQQRLARERRGNQALTRQLGAKTTRINTLEGELVAAQSSANALAPVDSTERGTRGRGEVTVEGVLKTAWTLGSELRPWPNDCSGARASYQVRVKDGAGATVAIGQIVDAQLTTRKVKHEVLSLNCSLTYSARLDEVSGSAYEFVTVDQSNPEQGLDAALVPGTSLRDGRGPELFQSFCPSCSPGF